MKIGTRHAAAAATLLLQLSIIPSARSATSLGAAIRENEIVVSNVLPGGQIVLFSLGRDGERNGIRVRSRAVLLRDDSQTGSIRFKPAEGVVLRSVWIAVDMSTGATATIAPPSYPLIVAKFPPNAFIKDGDGNFAALESALPRLKLLVVRPKKGAWLLYAAKGGKNDHGSDKLRLQFGDAVSLSGKDDPPKHLIPGDIAIAIDPGHLDIFVAEIGK